MMSTSRSAPEKKTAFRRWREGARWGLAASRIRCTFITASANSIYAGGREAKERISRAPCAGCSCGARSS